MSSPDVVRTHNSSPTDNGIVLDLFAGPGGWDEGAKPLGLAPIGIEWDMAACQTAMKAGHVRVRADVEQLPTEPMVGKVRGLIMSPPCQDFSLGGKKAGVGGDKGRLIAQVLRWTHDLKPAWVACEQVPPCLGFWQDYATVMRGWGYRTWVGILNAADYGVPQVRRRAILLASLDRQPSAPAPTHAREGGGLFDDRLPWVSMGEALGLSGLGVVGFPRRAASSPTQHVVTLDGITYRKRDLYSTSGPAQVVTEKARSWKRWASTEVPSSAGAEAVRVGVEEAAILQSFPRDYPWQGARTSQFQQVGNAIPPRLATHVLAAVTGLALPQTMEQAA